MSKVYEDAREAWERVAKTAYESAQKHHATFTPPTDALARVRRLGLLNWQLRGATHEDVMNVIGILANGDASLALILAMHFLVGGFGGAMSETPLGRAILDALAEQQMFCAAVSEQHTYSKDLASAQPRLKAEPVIIDGVSYFKLNGRKKFCTGIRTANFVLVSCINTVTGEAMMALVPTNAKGLNILRDWFPQGARATLSEGLDFHDVLVPEDMTVVMEPFVPRFLGAGILSFGYYTVVTAQLLLDILELAKEAEKGEGHIIEGFLAQAKAAMEQLMHAARLHDQTGPTKKALAALLEAKQNIGILASEVGKCVELGMHELIMSDDPNASGKASDLVRKLCDLLVAHRMPPHHTVCAALLADADLLPGIPG